MMADKWKTGPFLAVSTLLHAVMVALLAVVVTVPDIPAPDLVQVKIMEEEVIPANPDFQHGKILDVPPPEDLKSQPPKEAEALASFDAVAGGNTKTAPRRHTEKEAFSVEIAQPEKKLRSTPSDSPKSESRKKSPIPENRFSEIQAQPDKSPLPGTPSKAEHEPGTKTDKENLPETAALRGEDIDRFASANPSGFLDNGREAIVPLNTRKFEFIEYFSGIRRSLEDVWTYPADAMANGLGGRTVIRFTVLKTGDIGETKVVSSAGAAVLDGAAVAAIRTSGPFQPFPGTMDRDKLHIVAVFVYTPVYNKVP